MQRRSVGLSRLQLSASISIEGLVSDIPGGRVPALLPLSPRRRRREVHSLASRLTLPVLILHREADTIVPPAGSAVFFAQLPGPDKARLTYPGAYHDWFIELNRKEASDDIVQWIEQRL